MSPQSYYIGGKIRAADFNEFVNDINEIVGTGSGDSGYGQDGLVISQITAGSKVRGSDWQALLTAIECASTHQGTTINVPTNINDADFPKPSQIISIIPDLENDIANIRANKLNYDIANMDINSNTISSSRTYVDPASSGDYWTDSIFYEFRTTFTDSNHIRHFFNTGGEIRIDSTLSNYDVAHNQSVDWANLLSNIGIVKLSHASTSSSNAVGTPGVGYNSLTDTYQLVYTKGGTGYYSGNQINIYAKLNSTTQLDIKVSFNDAYTDTLTDYVDGTLSVSIDEQIANSSCVSLSSPTYSHITEL
jgi:hypothetical protein